jgi:alkylhydroperoxidase/carboxymuconolactone decarboxylase family protein YurZ
VDHREILRQLAIGDTSLLEGVAGNESGNLAASGLDAKSNAIACLGASVALNANPSGYQTHVDDAYAAGATTAEIVGVLIAVGPTVGLTRVVSAAPALGLAVGYDCDAALEQLDPTE